MCGIGNDKLCYEADISRDKHHTKSKRWKATRLEIDELHEYKTLHDKGSGTTPGEEVKKIRVHLLGSLHETMETFPSIIIPRELFLCTPADI